MSSLSTPVSASAHTGVAGRPQPAPTLIRVQGPPRLSLLPLLRAAIARSRKDGSAIAVAAGGDDPETARRRLETALLALGLPTERLLNGPMPAVSRTPPATPAAAALLEGLELFPTPEAVLAWVGELPADDRQAGEPKDPDSSPIFQAYALLADPMRVETMRLRFHGGISWDDARAALLHLVQRATTEPARRQAELLADGAGLRAAG